MYHKKVDFVNFNKNCDIGFRPLKNFGKEEIEERHKILYKLSQMIWE